MKNSPCLEWEELHQWHALMTCEWKFELHLVDSIRHMVIYICIFLVSVMIWGVLNLCVVEWLKKHKVGFLLVSEMLRNIFADEQVQ